MQPTHDSASFMRRDLVALFCAAPAGLSAFLHVADSTTIVSAKLADFSTFSAHPLVMGSVDEHEVRGRAAHFCTRHHESEMLRFNVLAALLQAMCHGRTDAHLITAQTLVDAVLQIMTDLVHVLLKAYDHQKDKLGWRVSQLRKGSTASVAFKGASAL